MGPSKFNFSPQRITYWDFESPCRYSHGDTNSIFMGTCVVLGLIPPATRTRTQTSMDGSISDLSLLVLLCKIREPLRAATPV